MVKELELESIVNQLSDSIILIDPRGDIRFYNSVASMNRVLAHRPLKVGKSLYDTISPERKELIQFLVETVVSYSSPQTIDAECKHPNGYSLFYDLTISPVHNDTRELHQICIVARDVTSQKSTDRKTSDLLHELSSLIENAHSMIFGVDASGYITEWNTESTLLTGYPKEEVLARRVEMLVEKVDQGILLDTLNEISNGVAVSGRVFNLYNKTGHTPTLLFNVTPKVNTHGMVIGATFMGQDITELSAYRSSLEKKVKERTEKLKQALEKEKELVEIRNKFVSIASHEFKIPLASITSVITDLLVRKGVKPSERRKLKSVHQQVTYMKAMLDDVLNTAKIHETKIVPRVEPLNIVSFIQRIIMEVVTGTQCTHNVVTDFPFPVVYIESDDKLLRNIFINLISNAIKYSPDQKEIFVSISRENEFVVVTIKDLGIGIGTQDLTRIFDPFVRGRNTEKIPGTGLGLSIVKKAIHALNGMFTIKSKLNEGTTFIVKLKQLKTT